MKNIFKRSTVLFVLVSLVLSSCKKDIDGCTEVTAMNYQDLATNNDGSCVFFYFIAQGRWDIETACEELIVSIPLLGEFPIELNDMFPDTVEITGQVDGVVAIDINGNIILADIANDGDVTIQQGQKISLDTGATGVVDVNINGSGMIESSTNGDLSLDLAFEIPLAGTQSSSCEITFSK